MIEIPGIDYIHDDTTKNAAVFFVNDLSDELKQIIRDNLSKISYGESIVSDDTNGYYNYKETLRSFLENYNSKKTALQKGLIGELIANILLRYYIDDLECISVSLNKEENQVKKGYDIVYFDKTKNCIRYSEVKSGEKNQDQTASEKNYTLLYKSKTDIVAKFTDKRKKLWDSAIADAYLVIKDNTKQKFIANLLQQDQIDNKRGKHKYSAILISVLFCDINNKLDFHKVCNFANTTTQANLFDDVMVFSIQKSTYTKVVDFLKEESND